MKRYLLILFTLLSLCGYSQRTNTFKDSSIFYKAVVFDSTIYITKGASNGKVLTSNGIGLATWQTINVGGRSVDTIYKNSAKDSIVFTISGIRYAVKDSFNLNTDSQTLSISNDTLTISGGNSVILPVYIQIDSSTINSYDVLNSQNTPPISPNTGDVYLVGTVPTGAWVGHAKDIAEWDGADWVFTDGVQGDFLYNATNALTYIFRSGNWVQTTGVPALNNGNTISSGLIIGTNNARSLTFETNNANRGRFDSVGRFHIYNLPTSSTSDTFVTKSDLSGKLTKVGQSTFLSGVNTSLFPNGQEIVTESRDFRDSDIDKLLIVVGNDITLTMPDSIVFSEQLRTIGLKFLQGYTGCGYQTIHGFTSKVLQLPTDGEFITLITGEYLGKSSVGSIADMQVNTDDGIVTLNKYLYDQSQNAIPLSGTVSGSPVTGDIEFEFDSGKGIVYNDENVNYGFVIADSPIMYYDGTANGLNKTQIRATETAFVISKESGEGAFIGLVALEDLSANITDLSYTQKIYVDQRISDTATQIRSEIPDVSNFATITNLADTSALLRGLIPQTLTFSTGLTNTSSTITNNFSTGVSGGQSVIGGTASGNNLTLSSTSNATKGKILFGNSTYNELTNMLGIGTTSPTRPIEVTRNTSDGVNYPSILIKNTNTSGESYSSIDLQVNNGAVWSQLLASGTNAVFGAPGMGFRVITGHPFFIQTNNVTRLTVAAGGNVGIGTLTPVASAKLELSSTTQGFLPPRMTATQRDAISSPATGLSVYNTTLNSNDSYDGTRWTSGAKFLTATATLDFGNTAAGTVSDLTITVTGAADGDAVMLGVPNASIVAAGSYSAWVSATNTVTVRYANNALVTAYDPASGTFKLTVNK